MRPWMWPWAAVYSAQVLIAFVVFSLINGERGGGWIVALVSGAFFLLPTVALWRARALFDGRPAQPE